jgi:hypothetical protein
MEASLGEPQNRVYSTTNHATSSVREVYALRPTVIFQKKTIDALPEISLLSAANAPFGCEMGKPVLPV